MAPLVAPGLSSRCSPRSRKIGSMNSSASNGSCAYRHAYEKCIVTDKMGRELRARIRVRSSRLILETRFFMQRLLGCLLVLVTSCCVRADEPLAYPPPVQVKAAFLKLLDRPKVALDPQFAASKEMPDGTVLESLTIASEKKADRSIERVPLLLLRPAKATGK